MIFTPISTLFPDYQFGIQLSQRVDNQVLISFNARNDHDRTKFVEDIRESIMEMDEMENLRIEAELERQKSSRTNRYGALAARVWHWGRESWDRCCLNRGIVGQNAIVILFRAPYTELVFLLASRC